MERNTAVGLESVGNFTSACCSCKWRRIRFAGTVIHVESLAKKHTVLIAKGLVQECLLGADFLQKDRCVVDLDK